MVLRALPPLPRFEDQGAPFTAYLLRIAGNLARNRWRAGPSRAVVTRTPSSMAPQSNRNLPPRPAGAETAEVHAGEPALPHLDTAFAAQIKGRPNAQLGIEEVVDFGSLGILTPRKRSTQFDGWAVVKRGAKSPDQIAKQFLEQLCESVGRTGYEDTLSFPA